MPDIVLDGVRMEFPGQGATGPAIALAEMDLAIHDREFVCLLGPSGCGKSTALNLIAGFLTASDGSVRVGGREVAGPRPDRGVVFQDANIFPWLSVAKNVAFGPSLSRRRDRNAIRRQVDEMLDRVGLSQFANHLPLELSGGMRQRVGLARVLVNDPPTLLMDEPFGALDAQTRIIMQELLLELWERDRKTVLFVTHDIDEALLLGDRIIVMTARPGRIKSSFDVRLPRPRRYEITSTPEFVALRRRLFEELRHEAARADELEAVH
ncbi:ABC transporter ATP-binding protein [Microtetraspora malaysiensis]|uniref:ABC transporter ATP-binding protein n=1 Tax=Microtetraspora malaysiensis TaxID=161358 RepID=UPI003D8B29AC